jgi:hypothetical protein
MLVHWMLINDIVSPIHNAFFHSSYLSSRRRITLSSTDDDDQEINIQVKKVLSTLMA